MQKHVNLVDLVKGFPRSTQRKVTPELFLERGGELRIVREDFSVYVRYCYVHLSKFSFFSFFPCPLFLIFFSKQIAIPTSIYLQNLASIQSITSPVKFARSLVRLEEEGSGWRSLYTPSPAPPDANFRPRSKR